jgi:hypothetical protein
LTVSGVADNAKEYIEDDGDTVPEVEEASIARNFVSRKRSVPNVVYNRRTVRAKIFICATTFLNLRSCCSIRQNPFNGRFYCTVQYCLCFLARSGLLIPTQSYPESGQVQHSRIYSPIAKDPCSICMASCPTTYPVPQSVSTNGYAGLL